MIDMVVCYTCGKELTNDNWTPYRQQHNRHLCKRCANEKSKELFSMKIERTTVSQSLYVVALNDNIRIRDKIRYHEYKTTSTKNKECAIYLGVNVAEEVLSRMFKNVIRMPYGHSGYDFICNKGMKIDSKASTTNYHNRSLGRWTFCTRRNTVADYFIFIAFDDREHLAPLHIWMIPSENFKDVKSTSISISALDKWNEYRLPLDNVVECCDTMR